MSVNPIATTNYTYTSFKNYPNYNVESHGENYKVYTPQVQQPLPVKVLELPDRYVETYKEEASTGRKVGLGVASAIIPGLGQAINGQWGKAAGFFFGSIVCAFIPFVNFIATPALAIWSVIDAVQNSGKEYNVVVPKDLNYEEGNPKNLDINA